MAVSQPNTSLPSPLRRAAAFLPAAVWYAVIFAFSAQTGEESSELSGAVVHQGVDWMGDWGQIFRVDWDALQLLIFLVRKAAHMGVFFILTGLLVFGLWRLIEGPLPRGAAALGLCALLAALDEFHQYFVPGRDGKLPDVLIDLGGAVCFLLLWWAVHRIRSRKRPAPAQNIS